MQSADLNSVARDSRIPMVDGTREDGLISAIVCHSNGGPPCVLMTLAAYLTMDAQRHPGKHLTKIDRCDTTQLTGSKHVRASDLLVLADIDPQVQVVPQELTCEFPVQSYQADGQEVFYDLPGGTAAVGKVRAINTAVNLKLPAELGIVECSELVLAVASDGQEFGSPVHRGALCFICSESANDPRSMPLGVLLAGDGHVGVIAPIHDMFEKLDLVLASDSIITDYTNNQAALRLLESASLTPLPENRIDLIGQGIPDTADEELAKSYIETVRRGVQAALLHEDFE